MAAFLAKLGSAMRPAAGFAGGIPSMFSRAMSSKLFVGGLPWATNDQSLKDAFETYGEVMDAKVIVDRDTGRSRGFGFVTFGAEEDAQRALQGMDGQDFGGRTIRVDFAINRDGQQREQRDGGRGRPPPRGPPRDSNE